MHLLVEIRVLNKNKLINARITDNQQMWKIVVQLALVFANNTCAFKIDIPNSATAQTAGASGRAKAKGANG